MTGWGDDRSSANDSPSVGYDARFGENLGIGITNTEFASPSREVVLVVTREKIQNDSGRNGPPDRINLQKSVTSKARRVIPTKNGVHRGVRQDYDV